MAWCLGHKFRIPLVTEVLLQYSVYLTAMRGFTRKIPQDLSHCVLIMIYVSYSKRKVYATRIATVILRLFESSLPFNLHLHHKYQDSHHSSTRTSKPASTCISRTRSCSRYILRRTRQHRLLLLQPHPLPQLVEQNGRRDLRYPVVRRWKLN